MEQKRLRICFVGCGRIARSHLEGARQAAQDVEIAALVSRDAQKGRAYADACGGAPVFASLAQAAAGCNFDAVDICLPNDLHRACAEECARLGKHILVEKPMANTVEDCRAMEKAAREAGVTLMVGQSRRYYPAVMKSGQMVASGETGALKCVTASLLGYLPAPPTPWWKSARQCGGLMIPLWGNHIFDYILWLFGEMPRTVYCAAMHLNPVWEGEDETAVVLTFSGGRFATVRMSWNTRRDETVWSGEGKILSSSDILYERYIQCERATLRLEDETLLTRNGAEVLRDDMRELNFARMLREFAAAIRQGRAPLTDAAVGRRVVAVQQACLQSAAQNKMMNLQGDESYV